MRLDFLFPRRWERRMDSELRFHWEALVADYIRRGSSRKEAERLATRDFGPMQLAKDECRDTKRGDALNQIIRDGHFAMRHLRRSPGFSIAVVLTLALGIGANTAIFSVVKAVLLNQLPYPAPSRLVALGEDDNGTKRAETIGYATAVDWRRLNHSFASMSLYRTASGALVENGEPELVQGMRVSYEFFDTLGIKVQTGRTFLPEEDRPDRRYEMILSDGLWRRRFGADPHVVGRVVRISETPFTVVGVLPPDFRSLEIPGSNGLPEIFMPLGYDLSLPYACRDCQHLHLIGRLKPAVTLSRAHAELDGIMADLVKRYPESYHQTAAVAFEALNEHVVGRFRVAVWMALGAVGLVLLVACANVANMMLARSINREREMALRAALGAARWRLLRQLLLESLILALAGGVLGVLLAWCGVTALAAAGPREIPRLSEVRIDGGTLWYAVLLSVFTAVLSGLTPAIRSTGLILNAGLKQLEKGTEPRSHRRLRGCLAAMEIAVAFTLITGAGLLAISLLRLLNVSPGYSPEHVLTAYTYVYGARYKDPKAELGYYDGLMERLRSAPGVESVAMTSELPLADFDRRGFHVRDRHPRNPTNVPSADAYSVSVDYFRTMRIPLLRGRGFLNSDGPSTPPVAVISDTCARQQFPHENPLGKEIQLGGRNDRKPWFRIVGVAGDVRQYGLDIKPNIAAYILQSQDLSFSYALVARTTGDAAAMENTLRVAARAADPTLPLFNIRPFETYLASSLAQRRFILMLVAVFGMLALALASIGVYGVIAYAVSTRTRDYGLRLALGATPRDVMMDVLRTGMSWIVAGLGTGILLSAALTRFMSSLLFEVQPADPAVSAAACVLLSAVTLCACWMPARRAAAVDPAVSLRYE